VGLTLRIQGYSRLERRWGVGICRIVGFDGISNLEEQVRDIVGWHSPASGFRLFFFTFVTQIVFYTICAFPSDEGIG